MENNTMDQASVIYGTKLFARRLAAFIIDWIIITLISFVPLFFRHGAFSANSDSLFSVMPVMLLIAFACCLFKDVFFGRSLGKLLLGIRVADHKTGKAPKLHKLILRNILTFIWPVEFIFMMKHSESRKLGDRMANTIVVGKPAKGLRTAVAVILAVLLFYCSAFFIATQIMRNDASYSTAIEYIKSSEDILSVTGDIKGFGSFPSGSLRYSNGYGSADLIIHVDGSKKDVAVEVYMTKTPDTEWTVEYADY